MRNKFLLIMALLLMPVSGLAQETAFKSGNHYRTLEEPVPVQGEGVQVLEFFSYGCPHCRSFEPYLQRWEKNLPEDVEFSRVPAIFGQGAELYAKAYYAVESLGIIEEAHRAIFDAIHVERQRLDTPEAFAELVAKQEIEGVDRETFLDAMNSFDVDSKLRRAKQLIREYRITGVPSMAVNGKYLAGGGMVDTYEQLVQVTDYLVKKELKAGS